MTDLARRLNQKATKAKAAAQKKSEAVAATRRTEREARIEAAAQEFKAARLEHIEEVMEDLASKGEFSYDVWRYPQGIRHGEEVEGIIRGMGYVRDWLRENGIRSDLVQHEENIRDYGYVNDWILTASWD